MADDQTGFEAGIFRDLPTKDPIISMNNSASLLIEVCIESVESAEIAEQAGADRIELNSALALGGLTPTCQLLAQVRSRVELPIICMVRPRPGDFFYSAAEFERMLEEARALLNAGADGLAVGVLTGGNRIDLSRLAMIREVCHSKELVFHRAFDCVVDVDSALQQLIQAGVDRILTSGLSETAWEGRETIKQLISGYADQIEILPGSGIRPSNVVDLVRETGCQQIHGTFSHPVPTGAVASTINFNSIIGLASNEKMQTDAEQIRDIVSRLKMEREPEAE